LEIDARRSRPVILETGSLGAAIKMFDQCSRDSLRDWGVDPDVEDKIVRRVWAPDVLRWFSSRDYPGAMLMQGKESEVRVRLLVDAAGDVSKCASLSHFNEPDFNRAVCGKFMKRAKFHPAELADGTKVPSYYINRVVFKMAR
jgi:TonB family protein